MELREELEQLGENAKKEMKQLYEKAKRHPLTFLICITVIVITLLLLIVLPHFQVAQFGMTNPKDLADAENSYRATLAQILGGIAVLIGIYFAWGNQKVSQDTLISNQKKAQDDLKVAQDTLEANMKIAQENLKVSQDGQITERYTRAIEQLGKETNLEIKLGGIYSLERISKESDKDHWPIMEILTACVRKTLPAENQNEVSLDIQAILTVIGRRENSFEQNSEKSNCIDLHRAYLRGAFLKEANLEGTNFERANLMETNLQGANLKKAKFGKSNLEGAELYRAQLREAYFYRAYLYRAQLREAHLEGANFLKANLKGANIQEAHLEWTNFTKATLEGTNFMKSNLERANLEYAYLIKANLEEADLKGANLKRANLQGANLKRANLQGADLEGANFEGANLEDTWDVTFDQLSEVKTLYKAELDEGLEAELRAKGFGHLLDDEPER